MEDRYKHESNMHTQGHIHRGNIHMKEQPHKETYIRKRLHTEGTYTREGHTHGRDMNMEATYIWRGHTRRGTYAWKRHEHGGDTHMEGTHSGRGHTHYVEVISAELRNCWSGTMTRALELRVYVQAFSFPRVIIIIFIHQWSISRCLAMIINYAYTPHTLHLIHHPLFWRGHAYGGKVHMKCHIPGETYTWLNIH